MSVGKNTDIKSLGEVPSNFCIKNSTLEVIYNDKYKENAIKISESFQNSGGAKKASDVILSIIDKKDNNYSFNK